MYKIKPTIFSISGEEIEEMVDEMIEENKLEANARLNKEQVIEVLEHVECDELLAKDIRMSIRDSILEVLSFDK